MTMKIKDILPPDLQAGDILLLEHRMRRGIETTACVLRNFYPDNGREPWWTYREFYSIDNPEVFQRLKEDGKIGHSGGSGQGALALEREIGQWGLQKAERVGKAIPEPAHWSPSPRDPGYDLLY